MKSSPSIWQYIVGYKSTVKILSNFVAFLENTNFNKNWTYLQFLLRILIACYVHLLNFQSYLWLTFWVNLRSEYVYLLSTKVLGNQTSFLCTLQMFTGDLQGS